MGASCGRQRVTGTSDDHPNLGETRGFGDAGQAGRLGGLLPTLSAGTLVQVASTLAALATIPVLVHALGASRFGVLIVVVSLAPWLTLIDGALYPTTRLLVGEARTDGVQLAPQTLLREAFRLAIRIAAANAATLGVAVIVLPLVALFGAEGVATRGELVMAILLFAAPIVASGPGGIYLGALEGVGRTVVAAILAGIGPLVALPLTLGVVALGGDLVPLCAAQGLAAAVPRIAAWAYWHHKPSQQDATTTTDRSHALRLRLVLQMATMTAAVLIQSGLDPVIVSSQLGADAAAAYGLAWRLVSGAMIPLTVVTPLFMANIAAARAGGWTAHSNHQLRRLVALYALAGVVVAAGIAAVGPPLANLLGGGKVAHPYGLYLAGAGLVLVTFASTPLYLAMSGPSALSWSVRLNVMLTVANVSASLVLVDVIGVSGPLWASAAAGLVGFAALIGAWVRHPEWLSEVHAAPANQAGPFSLPGWTRVTRTERGD
jgi:O-antigen/teichoic acid export membrane protein